ncbi:metal-binding protein [Alcanivorax sp. N3-2A]|nr:metal-binding protein [Alcanivorax sp. N3-2A]
MKRFVLSTLMLLVSGLAAAGTLEVYKSPYCGCCEKWVAHMREHGFDVNVHDTENLQAIKVRAGLQPGQGSCHTAFIDGYAIEGHVPAGDVKRLLKEKPDARGLTVPGMPAGSPGMEMGEQRDAYQVLLFGDQGSRVFARYP